jgi:hypothetical protein
MDRKPEPTDEKPSRKPYQKPQFEHERIFETMALQCGKVQPHTQGCIQSPKNS